MPDSAPGWPRVEPRPDLPAMERDILAQWERDEVFHTSMRQREGAPVWTFYEGPPTANGMPGTHHVEARVFKDIFPRYRTMKGLSVRRKGGWDCHGLPVELEVEKELGLNSKAEIEAYGIEAFNARCRESVQRYVGAFEELTERIGFWIDTDDAYRTMDAEYVDSLWWALKQLWDRDLIFEDHRVTPYCARCGTGLSDAEVAQGYQTVVDPSIYVRFPLTEPIPGVTDADGAHAGREVALIIWTTTPWTLSNNAGVVVGPDVAYQLVDEGREQLSIVAAERREATLGEDAEVLAELTADQLAGLHYEAPFTFTDYEVDQRFVLVDPYVTTSDGSGLVHISPGFGVEDHAIVKRMGFEVFIPVDLQGRFTHGPWTGTFVKDADQDIIRDLDERDLLVKALDYEHTYPFCWRCKRPLLYYAKPSWYIRTTAKRDELLANNAGIDWHPEHIRAGRFGNWLENNVDWALSRDRYWGTPLPFWRCDDCEHVTVVGSRQELSELSGQDHLQLDPHRPFVDDVTLPCGAGCGGTAHRVPEVADAWFDSGGMPFAQWGYPHTGVEEFERHYPADYICEAIDQTRGWFYSLLAESTLLFGDASYKTCVCLGHIVDEDGRKMSKSTGNVLDPFVLLDQHGADALRWLMFAEGNPWVNRRVGHDLLEDVVRRLLLTVWNTHVFFTTYAAIDGIDLRDDVPAVAARPAIDRWMLAELAALVETVDTSLDGYDVSTATRAIERFVDDLSNWYVRRNRRRFWKSVADDPADKRAAYATLHTCLTTLAQVLAPFTPFLADRLWQDLVVSQDPSAPSSVHLSDFPVANETWRDEELRAAMGTARRVVELGRQARNDAAVKVRQPLGQALVTVPAERRAGLHQLLDDIAEELNVRAVVISDGTGELVDATCKPNFRALGPAFQGDAPKVAAAISALDTTAARTVIDALEHGAAVIEVDGASVTLTPEMVEVIEQPRTGWAVASEGAISFALDTTLTRDLEVEGAARELIRAINDQRKAADLALDDRIELVISVQPAELDGELAAAGLFDAIARDVLATSIQRAPVADGTRVELGSLGHALLAMRPA